MYDTTQKAQMAVEDGNDCDSLVGQVMEQGGCNFQPNNMPNKPQQSRVDDPHIDNNLKANMDWTKVVNSVQRTIAQYSQLILKVHGTRATPRPRVICLV